MDLSSASDGTFQRTKKQVPFRYLLFLFLLSYHTKGLEPRGSKSLIWEKGPVDLSSASDGTFRCTKKQVLFKHFLLIFTKKECGITRTHKSVN